MSGISKDLILLLQFLMPGFLVAWVLYGITSQVKPPQFERVVQALIFTVLVNAAVMLSKLLLLGIGEYYPIMPWGAESTLLCSILWALVIGFLCAWMMESDHFHGLLRKCKMSKRSGYSSEWAQAFHTYQNYMVFHLKNGRRLQGWAELWPSDPEKGHFFIILYQWLDDEVGKAVMYDSSSLSQSSKCVDEGKGLEKLDVAGVNSACIVAESNSSVVEKSDDSESVVNGLLIDVKDIEMIEFCSV